MVLTLKTEPYFGKLSFDHAKEVNTKKNKLPNTYMLFKHLAITLPSLKSFAFWHFLLKLNVFT